VAEDFVAGNAGGVQLSRRSQQAGPIADRGSLAKIKRRQMHPRSVEKPKFAASARVQIGSLLGNPLGLTSQGRDVFSPPRNLAVLEQSLEPAFQAQVFPQGRPKRLHDMTRGRRPRLALRTDLREPCKGDRRTDDTKSCSLGRPRRQTSSTRGPCRLMSSPNAASSRRLANRSSSPASLMGSMIKSHILSEIPNL